MGSIIEWCTSCRQVVRLIASDEDGQKDVYVVCERCQAKKTKARKAEMAELEDAQDRESCVQ